MDLFVGLMNARSAGETASEKLQFEKIQLEQKILKSNGENEILKKKFEAKNG